MTKKRRQDKRLVRAPGVPEIPGLLREDFREGRVVLFLGAGVSMSAGAPSWEDLVDPLLRKAGLDLRDLDRLSPEQKVSLLVSREGSEFLQREIERELMRPPGDRDIHKQLVSLPVSLILTTNYDPYLTQAAADIDRECNVIEKDSDLPTRFAGKSLVIAHLYGSAREPRASEEDLVSFERTRPALSMLLQQVFLTHTVFFLGFSFRDYNVLNHILRIPSFLAGAKRRHYAYILEPQPISMVDLWARERGLEILATHGFHGDKHLMSETFRKFVRELVVSVSRWSAKVERERRVLAEETDFYNAYKGDAEKLCMRRESTSSVLSLPDTRRLSGLQSEGFDIGAKRKSLYRDWARRGSMRLVLSLDADHLLSRYTPRVILMRLKVLRNLLCEDLDDQSLIIGVRRGPPTEDYFATLGEKVLLSSSSVDTSDAPYKRTEISRDHTAIRVFKHYFDLELEGLAAAAESRLRGRLGPNVKERWRFLRQDSLEQIEAAMNEIRRREQAL